MKIKHLLLTVLAGTLTIFTSCVEEEGPVSSLSGIELGSSYITIARGQQTASTTMKINESWTSRVPEWLTLDPASGAAGDYTLTFKAKADTLDQGQVQIIFGGKTQIIKVTRDGDKPKPAGVLFEEPFVGHGQGDFEIKDVVGSPWSYDAKYGMKATAYINNANTDADSYLISPEIDLTGESAAILTFEDAVNYMNGNPVENYLSVEVTSDNGANWEKVTVPQWPAGSGWDFFESGNVDLSKFVGKKIKFAFHYTSNTAASPTWEVKNVKLANAVDTTPVLACDKPEVTVGASDTEAAFTIKVSNLKEGWTVTTDAAWVTEFTESGSANDTAIAVKFEANTVAEDRTATFTVKSAGATDLVLTLKQLAYQENGTADKPYTVAEALEVINALEDNATTPTEVYVSGVINEVQSVDTGSYGNASYLISDTGSAEQVLTVFRGYYLENAKFSAEDQIAKGDVVVVKGKLQKYVKDAVTTPEIAAKNYLHSLARPMTVAAALAEIATMADGATAETEVYIKGIVTGTPNVDTGSYGNATFDIVDAAGSTDKLTIFRAYSFGNEKFTSDDVFNVGDEVIVIGKLQRYVKDAVMTPEVSKGHLVAVFAGSGVQPEQVPALFLNEFQCKPDKRIEIYNSTDAEVDMTGWVLLKNDGEEGAKDTFVIPENMAKVPAKGFAVFNCKQSDVANGPLFGLSGDGGFKIALMKGNTVVDVVDNLTSITVIPDGKSWGRETDGAEKFVIFDTPTIGASNGAAPAPAAPKTIAELLAAIPSTATGNNTAVEVDVDFTDPVTVSYVNGKNAYLEDATGAILLYLDNHGLQAGFTIKGQLKVKGYWYNGIPELVSFSGTPTVGQGTVPETAVTIAQLLADYNKYLLRRVKLTDVKVTDGIADGDRNGSIAQADGSTIAVYAQINNGGLVLTAGDQGNLLTIPGLYNANKQVYFWQNDWWESTATDLPPTITIADITGVPAAGVTDATATVTFANNEGWEATATPDGTVVTAASIDGTTLKYTVAENTAYQARDGKITITLKKDGKDNVTKDVKVSQLAAEEPAPEGVTKVTWVRSGTTDTVSEGYELFFPKSSYPEAKTDYYQDKGTANSQVNAFILQTKDRAVPVFTSTPESISLTVKLRGGSAKDPMDYPLYACLVDAEGNDIAYTVVEVVKALTTTFTDYEVSIPVTDVKEAYGVKLYHTKESSWNVRYQAITWVITEGEGGNTDSGSGIPDYDPINGFTW